jgi:hypothetical protein
MKEKYFFANGFHNTEAYIWVEPTAGTKISTRQLDRVSKKLCGMTECCCGSSPASNPKSHQRTGFQNPEHRNLVVDIEYDYLNGRDYGIVREHT